MSTGWKRGWKRGKRATPKQLAAARRRRLLSAPITSHQIEMFTKHLVAVAAPNGGECWLYGGITQDGYLDHISTAKYPTMTVNGVHGVRVYRFALAASEGVSIIDLEGSDVHHESPTGDCWGYTCCRPEHLHKKPSPEVREHRGTRGPSDSLIRYQMHLVDAAVALPYSELHPDTGPDHNFRLLGGVSFRIRGGVLSRRENRVNRVGVRTVWEKGKRTSSQEFIETTML